MKFLLMFAVLGLVACHQAPPSRLHQEDRARPVNPFPLPELGDAETKTVAARVGYTEDSGSPDNGKCIGCHQNFNNIDELDRLYGSTSQAYSCFDRGADTRERANAALNCLASLSNDAADLSQVTANTLGFMAAGVNHKAFENVFKTAGREAEYQDFKDRAGMPLGGTPFQDNDFDLLLSWVLSYYPSLADFLTHDGPSVCATTAETHIGAQFKEYVRGMSEGGQSWEYVNLARGLPMFACPDSNKHNCFTQSKDQKDIFPLVDEWKAPGLSGHIRILHTYDQYTDYWIRSSADGRFVGNGGNPSAIIDLDSKLKGLPARKIKVEALYDPGFLPDNSGFIFQGERHGSRICDQNILLQADLSTIDFKQAGCSKSDLQIGLYQGIGNSVDSGDIRTLASYFSSDEGYTLNRDIAPLFGASANITIDTIRRVDGSNFEKVESQSIATPYHGSWQMSPANRMATAVVSGSKNGRAQHGGYRLFVMNDDFGRNGQLPDWKDDSTATLCTEGGEKPNVSYDERFLAFYRYGKHEKRVPYEESSSDIYIFDLLKGTEPVALTAMPKGFYAQFPHYRSDGWLYFTVYNALTDERFVVATDAGVYFQEK